MKPIPLRFSSSDFQIQPDLEKAIDHLIVFSRTTSSSEELLNRLFRFLLHCIEIDGADLPTERAGKFFGITISDRNLKFFLTLSTRHFLLKGKIPNGHNGEGISEV